MTKVKIYNADEYVRPVLLQALNHTGMEAHCAFVEDTEEGAEDLCLKVYNADTDQPKQSDIFTQPVRLGAVLDRIRRYVEADQVEIQNALNIGPFTLAPFEYDLKHENNKDVVRLTDKERDILVFLKQKEGREVERSEILSEVWGYAETVETHTLETHIYRLRQKIEDDPANPKLLLTKERGYILNA